MKRVRFLLTVLLFVLCSQLQAQHIHLEVKFGGGLAFEKTTNKFRQKGFDIEQRSNRIGYLMHFGVSTPFLSPDSELNYNLRRGSFLSTDVYQYYLGTPIASPAQHLSVLQHYGGVTIYPFAHAKPKMIPYVYVGLGYNVISLKEEGSGVMLKTPVNGDHVLAVSEFRIVTSESTFGAMGYETAIGLKYHDTEKFGLFVQARFNQILQRRTDLVADKFNLGQVEIGTMIRIFKSRRSI